MNFFKKLFSSKAEAGEKPVETDQTNNLSGVYSESYFEERYSLDTIKPEMLDGCLKMIESYVIENKIERKVESPVNHPLNLDQVDREGFGFVLYCKAFQLDESQAVLFMAYAFSEFLVMKYGFQLYKDSTPEYPLRGMTLKYDRDGVVLSLYPFEYASKVLNGNETFSEMDDKLSGHLKEMPKKEDLLGKFGV